MNSIELQPDDVDVRVGLTDDVPFIVKTWLGTHRKIYPNIYALDRHAKITPIIMGILDRSTVLVAHLADEPSRIVSYLVHSMRGPMFVVSFAYTDEGARRRGIVTRLIEMANAGKAPVVFTQAPANENVMRRVTKKYIFDPSLA